MSRIVVTRALPEPALRLLEDCGETWVSPQDGPLPRARLLDAVAGADALVTMLYDRVDAELLDAAGPSLRCVANVAVGFDNIDLEAAAARGVTVTNTPGVLTDATADLAIALLLMTTRRLGEAERRIRSGADWSWDVDFMLGAEAGGRVLGIVGLGAIGRAVAHRARALGMEIVYSQRSRLAAELEQGARFLALDELLAIADVVSLHCPLTPATRHLLDGERLARMQRGAFLVNTARGPIVDEAALAQALRSGRLAGAGLDVHEHEPRVSPELMELENVVLLPHLGSATVETRTAMARLAALNVADVLGGREPRTPVSAR